MNIICFGDSITQCVPFADADRWPVVLQRKLDERYGLGFKVYNRGVGGHTVSQSFDRFDTDVLPLLPGLVLIEFGFNDVYTFPFTRERRTGIVEFENKLRAFHRIIKGKGGTSVFIVNHLVHEARIKKSFGNAYLPGIRRYNQKIRDVAKALHAPIIDLPAMMKQRKVDLDTFTREYDGLHLNHFMPESSHVYADMVFNGLEPVLSA